MKYAKDITELIGNTPLVKLKDASVNGTTVRALAKNEGLLVKGY